MTDEGVIRIELHVPAGAACAIGSLPHRDAQAAAAFVLEHLGDLPALPSLPRRSTAEGTIAQGVLGIRGVSLGPYGSLAVDVDALDPEAPVTTDLGDDRFTGFRALVGHLRLQGRAGPVKWQLVGPITLGVALVRAGVPPELAFPVGLHAVRSHLSAIERWVAASLPAATQVIVLDEPDFADVTEADFPLPLDAAIDAVSSALAVVEPFAVTGVHCCRPADWPSLLAAGPQMLFLPVDDALAAVSGYFARFLDSGGWIGWGAVCADGPVPASYERPARRLGSLWAALSAGGCDPELLRGRSLITPSCGLGAHSEGVARRVFRIVGDLSRRVREQAIVSGLPAGG